MKIAFVYDVIYPYVKGGAEKRIYELSLSLVKSGHEVHIFGMKYWDGSSVIEKEGVIYHGVCRPKELYVKGRRSFFQAVYFSVFLFFPLLREKFDIIDCQAFPYFPVFTSLLVSVLKKTPLVVTWHEFWGDYWYEYIGFSGVFGKFTERICAVLSKNQIAVSDLTADRLKKRNCLLHNSHQHVCVVPNGVNKIRISDVMPSAESCDILFAGRLIASKNVDLILRSLVLVKNKLPFVKAVIIGDGPEINSLKSLSAKLDISENVSFKGFLEDELLVFSAMKSAKVFVLPSTREGFGIVAIEAMACGISVVTVRSNSNAAASLIKDGEDGIITDPDPESFADGILTAILNEDQMGDKALTAANRYDVSEISKEIVFYYEKVLKSSG
ncbi:glycosyltransferase family 4 protein [Methanomicrobium antiquum]|uniref:Glycosyltransferase family 4 protein n=1 Tax=Methanomicrobium antiquum TaxID=487686 RepID=A0AAF0FQK1_9EURY|nr:glycosyltransferase family 4 protein [Methanomicrobium antiquum]WFN36767.1 glycosyltransferase family 4 protein [Methanomicrobium antiquum]